MAFGVGWGPDICDWPILHLTTLLLLLMTIQFLALLGFSFTTSPFCLKFHSACYMLFPFACILIGQRFICRYLVMAGSRDSSVGIATGWTVGVPFMPGAGHFSLLQSVQTGSGDHPASYPMDIGGSFPEGKAAGA
jgi:hypothetical protein